MNDKSFVLKVKIFLGKKKARFVHVLAEAFQCKENIPSEV